MLALALLLLEVKDEADIFYLCVDISILKPRLLVFAYCSQFFGVGCVLWTDGGGGEVLTVFGNFSIFELLNKNRFTRAPPSYLNCMLIFL